LKRNSAAAEQPPDKFLSGTTAIRASGQEGRHFGHLVFGRHAGKHSEVQFFGCHARIGSFDDAFSGVAASGATQLLMAPPLAVNRA
jgi:hypothetical protein